MVLPHCASLGHAEEWIYTPHFTTYCAGDYLLARPAVDVDGPVPSHTGAPHGVHHRAAKLRLQSKQLFRQHFSVQSILQMITARVEPARMLGSKCNDVRNR